MAEVKATGEALQPGFFIEVEGATDLYAKYVDRFLTHFGAAGPLEYPRLFRYTVPWSRTDCGQYPLDDGAAVRANIEHTLLLGCTFRVSGGKTSGDWSPDDPVFNSEGMRLMKAAIAARRFLIPYIDEGSFLDDVGLSSEGCEEATWFSGSQGLLLVAKVTSGEGSLRISLANRDLLPGKALDLDWQTGEWRPVSCAFTERELEVKGLAPGLHLITIPAKS